MAIQCFLWMNRLVNATNVLFAYLKLLVFLWIVHTAFFVLKKIKRTSKRGMHKHIINSKSQMYENNTIGERCDWNCCQGRLKELPSLFRLWSETDSAHEGAAHLSAARSPRSPRRAASAPGWRSGRPRRPATRHLWADSLWTGPLPPANRPGPKWPASEDTRPQHSRTAIPPMTVASEVATLQSLN